MSSTRTLFLCMRTSGCASSSVIPNPTMSSSSSFFAPPSSLIEAMGASTGRSSKRSATSGTSSFVLAVKRRSPRASDAWPASTRRGALEPT